MPTTITMPQLGETVTEGTVAQWLKAVGERIDKYEPFVEVSTDKVNAEVPSPVSGVLLEIVAREGEIVPIGGTIAIIQEVVVEVGTHAAPPIAAPEPTAAPPAAATAATAAKLSPAARRLARERGIDAAALAGTGTNGRVSLDDIAAAATPAAAFVPLVPPPALVPPGKSTYAKAVAGTRVALSPARRLIAQRMSDSLANAPHAWTSIEVDVTQLDAKRESERERFFRERGAKLTLLPFFVHAVVVALRAHPLVNAAFRDGEIETHARYDIGIAIGLPDALVVPVVRAADTRSISGLALEIGRLVTAARTSSLGADDLAGGTCTVNNNGANGSVLSAPIIHDGQAAIVTMEAVVKRPVVIAGDAIAIRRMMNVCLSVDHRVLDGTVANGFLRTLRATLEAMGPTTR